MWRGGLRAAYLLPALSSAGASRVGPCSVFTSRSSLRVPEKWCQHSRREKIWQPSWRQKLQVVYSVEARYKVGHGYILGLPVAAYLTWQGRIWLGSVTWQFTGDGINTLGVGQSQNGQYTFPIWTLNEGSDAPGQFQPGSQFPVWTRVHELI